MSKTDEFLDWKKAESHLYLFKQLYEQLGDSGIWGLENTIYPLINRYVQGERTKQLYNEMMNVE